MSGIEIKTQFNPKNKKNKNDSNLDNSENNINKNKDFENSKDSGQDPSHHESEGHLVEQHGDDREYDTFQDTKKQELLYSTIMYSRISKYHILPGVIYILALITLEFLILQVVIFMKPLFTLEKIEIITFVSLIFLGVASGTIIKNLLFDNKHLKNNILISSIATLSLIVFVIITKSDFLLFLCYTPISIGVGVILFTSKQVFEDYFFHDYTEENTVTFNSRTYKNILISSTSFASLLVILNIYVMNPELSRTPKWNLGLLVFATLLLSIMILSIFLKDSPISLYRHGGSHNKTIFKILEDVRRSPLNEEERKVVLNEIFTIIEKEDSYNFTDLYYGNLKKQSVYYSISTICNSFVITSILISIPTRILNSEINSSEFYLKISIVFLLGALGKLIGSAIIRIFTFKRKFILIAHFSLIFVFSFLLIFWFSFSYIFAGLILLLSYSLFMVLLNFAYEVYPEALKDKAYRAYEITFYISGALAVILFELFYYTISPTAGFIILALVSLTGFVVACLQNF